MVLHAGRVMWKVTFFFKFVFNFIRRKKINESDEMDENVNGFV